MSDKEINERRYQVVLRNTWWHYLGKYEQFLIINGYSMEYEKTNKLQRRRDLIELLENLQGGENE